MDNTILLFYHSTQGHDIIIDEIILPAHQGILLEKRTLENLIAKAHYSMTAIVTAHVTTYPNSNPYPNPNCILSICRTYS